jgi:hypothetical protein
MAEGAHEMKRSLRLRLFLAAMPLFAGLHEAFAAAGRDMEHQPSIEWLSTFCNELALRLPLSLILAFTVFALIGAAGAFLSRLDGASVSAQAARHHIDLRENTPVVPNLYRMELVTRRASGLRSFQLGRVT